jgi:hypothetical protein
MKDIITLKSSQRGKGLRFVISRAIREDLNTKFGDTIQINIYGIYKEGGDMKPIEPSIPMPSIISKIGSNTQGITMKRNIVKLLNLGAEQMLAVDIEKKKDI